MTRQSLKVELQRPSPLRCARADEYGGEKTDRDRQSHAHPRTFLYMVLTHVHTILTPFHLELSPPPPTEAYYKRCFQNINHHVQLISMKN